MAQAAEKEQKAAGALSNFRRKTVVNILRTWRGISGSARIALTGEVRPDLPKEDMEHLLKKMHECLDSKGGEVTARAQTVELGRTYLHLNEVGKAKFLRLLAEEFDLDHLLLEKRAQAVVAANDKSDRIKIENGLRDALVAPRTRILRQFNSLPNGFKFLVDMRADLMPLAAKDPTLASLENDLKSILATWFDIGLLDLVEITWNSPAALLEKLIEYEAVHKIKSWDDLKNRLDADRRVFAFLHNKMPNEPLIFVQVALVEGMSDNIQALLDEQGPVTQIEDADTAIFYSISNAQRGLAGISFGNFLIKRVVDKLTRERKQIKTYATLSPVPGFRAWLDPLLAKEDEALLLPAEKKVLREVIGNDRLVDFKQFIDGEWYKDVKLADKVKPILLRLCTHYLVNEKRRGKAAIPGPLDPVAQFHLFNGARLERINWLGDVSPKGMKQSAGIMVNYHYKLADIDDNHEAFVSDGKIVVGKQVAAFL